MIELSRISLNTFFQVCARSLEFLSGILVNAWLARQWGSGAFGQIGFYTSLAGTCSFLFDCGLSSLLMRAIARDRRKARTFLLQALLALLPISLVGTLCIVGLGLLWLPSASALVLFLSSLLMALAALTGLLQAVFFAWERMEWESVSVFTERMCWLLAGFWLALQPPSLVSMFLWLCGCKLVSLLIGGFLFIRGIWPQCEKHPWKPSESFSLIREAFPFALNLVFSTVYVGIDLLLVARWAGDSAAGYYRAASMLIVPLTVLVAALNNALFPLMATSESGLRNYGRISVRWALAAAIPLCILIALFAPGMIRLLFGAEFGPAVLLLRLLALVVPLRFLNHSLATMLTAGDRQVARTRTAGIAAGFNILANVLVIGHWGAVGACITTILTDVLRTVLLWSSLPRVELSLARVPGCALMAGGILLPLALAGIPLLPATAILGLLYPCLLWRFFLHPDELTLLRRSS